MFPTINHINEILPYVEGNSQFRVAVQPNGFTVVCYMLQDENTFAGENEHWTRECRGITFAPDGKVASRTMHKFQNVGESEATQPDQIPWDKITRIMDKRDGSMVTFLEINGNIVAKTKKAFDSAEAKAATEFLHQDPKKVEWVHSLLRGNFTPTFEWTSPRFPIVLTYDKDELTLLQIRENTTGRYITSLGEGGAYTRNCPFPIVENLRGNFSAARELLELARTETGVEGWIIQTDDGDMWKIKTKWYCDLHHAVTFTRWRDVAKAVANDQSDDLKAAFSMTGRSIQPILRVENAIHNKIFVVKDTVERHVKEAHDTGLEAKDLALKLKQEPFFSLIMRAFRGQPVNYMEWYTKHCLDIDWGLEVIPVTQPE